MIVTSSFHNFTTDNHLLRNVHYELATAAAATAVQQPVGRRVAEQRVEHGHGVAVRIKRRRATAHVAARHNVSGIADDARRDR